jgi:hypothetical protein
VTSTQCHKGLRTVYGTILPIRRSRIDPDNAPAVWGVHDPKKSFEPTPTRAWTRSVGALTRINDGHTEAHKRCNIYVRSEKVSLALPFF